MCSVPSHARPFLASSWQLSCMRRYFWFAALLDRTLIIPRTGFRDGHSGSDYWWHWGTVLDASHVRRCLRGKRDGRDEGQEEDAARSLIGMSFEGALGALKKNSTVSGDSASGESGGRTQGTLNRDKGSFGPPKAVTLDEWLQHSKDPCLAINQVVSFTPHGIPRVGPDYVIPGVCLAIQDEKGTPMAAETSIEVLDPSATKSPFSVTEGLLRALRGYPAPVLSLGALTSEEIEGHDVHAPAGPFPTAKGCRGDLWGPHTALSSLAERVAANLSGGAPFAAVHLRRWVHHQGEVLVAGV